MKIKKQKYWYVNCDIYVDIGRKIGVEYYFVKRKENKMIRICKEKETGHNEVLIKLPHIPQRVDANKMKKILEEAKREKYLIERTSAYISARK